MAKTNYEVQLMMVEFILTKLTSIKLVKRLN